MQNYLPLSIGIILQERDCFNVMSLFKRFRLFFPNQEIIVFYSGNKSDFFEEFEKIIKNNQGVLIFEEQDRNIGYARNSIVSKANNPWILMCDGDILLPDDFGRNLIQLFQNSILQDEKVALIQSFVDLKENSNQWAMYDFYNDTLAYLSDRTKSDEWFNVKNFNIPYTKELTTIQGVCTLFRKSCYEKVGASDEISAGIDRSLAVKFNKAGYKIYFIKDFRVLHIYPSKLFSIIKRKFWHSAGSLYIRRRFPEYYKDSFLVRLKMLKSSLFPPSIFRTFYGRIYYLVQMTTFIFGLYYHQLFNKDGIDKRQKSISY